MQCVALCPDGHRVTVKFNRQTPLLTILEEACQKRKLDPDVHALRRENERKNLDTSLTAAFAGLPNHCRLEVVPCEKGRDGDKKLVKVALQVEGGGRVVGEYNCEDALSTVVDKSVGKLDGNRQPVVIYMRQEFVGPEALASTTLRKMGLTSGSAVLRLLFRDPDSLNDQAKFVKVDLKAGRSEEPKETPWRAMRKESDDTSDILKSFKTDDQEVPVACSKPTIVDDSAPSSMQVDVCRPEVESRPSEENSVVSKSDVDQSGHGRIDETSHFDEEKQDEVVPEKPSVVLNVLDDDHQTVIYKLSDSNGKIRTSSEDVSDDFFDLTIADAKILLRDVRRVQKDSESDDQVLMTAQMRAAQKEGQKLALLNRYKRTAVRVQLPDRHVVQAIFMSGHPLSAVMDNLKRYLSLGEGCELFTTPPKTVLRPESTLLDLDLTPASLVYLSCPSFGKENRQTGVVKADVRLSNSLGAEKALADSGVLGGRKNNGENASNFEGETAPPSSSSGTSYEAVKRPLTTPSVSSDPNKKVPRWFKPGKN